MSELLVAAAAEGADHWRLDDLAGWRLALADGIEQSPRGPLRLAALPSNGRPITDAAGTFGGFVEPTAVAVDGRGRIYVLDAPAALIKRFDPCRGSFEPLPCLGGEGPAPRQLRQPSDIAVSARGLLAVADRGNARLQIFGIDQLALVAVLGPLDVGGSPWDPFGVVFDSCGRLVVSDPTHGLLHRFTARLRRLDRLNDGGGGAGTLGRPTHLAAAPDGRVYVVDEQRGAVVVIDADGAPVERLTAPEHLAGRFTPGPLATDAAGNLYVADRLARLWRPCRPGRQGTPVCFAMAPCSPADTVAGLAFDAAGNPLAVDGAGRRVICLAPEGAFPTTGEAIVGPLDSGIVGCTWHRVLLDGDVPTGCVVEVDTLTSDIDKDLTEIEQLPDDPWETGAAWVGPDQGPWDRLLVAPPGRWLWLRLRMRGTGKASPTVAALRAWFPRRSSLEYLPAVYSVGPGGAFLDRFLSLFDEQQGRIDAALDRLPACFDPATAPAEPVPRSPSDPPQPPSAVDDRPDFLSWLGSWFGIAMRGTWSTMQRRRVLSDAVRLFGRRGTVDGVRDAVAAMADLPPSCGLPVPGVLEDFKLRRWFFASGSTLGDHTTLWGRRIVDRLQLGETAIGEARITDLPDPRRDPFHHFAHRFTVFLPASCARDERRRRAVEQAIEITMPAHTQYRLELVEPRLRVGVQSTVGVDAVVGRPPTETRTGESTVGFDTVLRPDPAAPPPGDIRIGGQGVIGGQVL